MTPDLGVVLAAGGVLAFTVGLGVAVMRVPRCRGCGRPGVAEARAIADVDPRSSRWSTGAGPARPSSADARWPPGRVTPRAADATAGPPLEGVPSVPAQRA